MTITAEKSGTDAAVAEYVARCRPHLDDLPAEVGEQLADDIAQIVAEVATELDGRPDDLVGPPDRFAAELRAAAGLPARLDDDPEPSLRAWLRLTARPWLQRTVRSWSPRRRAAVAAGFVVVVFVAGMAVSSGGDEMIDADVPPEWMQGDPAQQVIEGDSPAGDTSFVRITSTDGRVIFDPGVVTPVELIGRFEAIGPVATAGGFVIRNPDGFSHRVDTWLDVVVHLDSLLRDHFGLTLPSADAL